MALGGYRLLLLPLPPRDGFKNNISWAPNSFYPQDGGRLRDADRDESLWPLPPHQPPPGQDQGIVAGKVGDQLPISVTKYIDLVTTSQL